MTNQDLDVNGKVDQWSNGVDQADELYRLMKVRRAALDKIGLHTIRAGAPTATIEEPLVPIFMYHRYAVESAADSLVAQAEAMGITPADVAEAGTMAFADDTDDDEENEEAAVGQAVAA